MSAAQALLLPVPTPDETPRRHLDIAPTRAQRRARPRVVVALVAIAGMCAIMIAQLLMSIVLADGAYQLSSLQREKRDIVREQNAAKEELAQLSSTQNLIQNASHLGMMTSGNPIFLDVASGQARGVEAPAKGQIVGSGGNLISNALVSAESSLAVPLSGGTVDEAAAVAPVAGPVAGVVDSAPPAASPTTPGLIPSPTTR